MTLKPYYDDGNGIVIYHGDAREIAAWRTADVLVTDPPYGMTYVSGWLPRPIRGDSDTSVRDAVLALWGDRPARGFG
jgi:site-specific DNA-methyltransferase (adenine-specific)